MTDGIEAALERAREAAGTKDVFYDPKAEWHWYRGYQLEDRQVDYFTMPAESARYGLLSFAVSF